MPAKNVVPLAKTAQRVFIPSGPSPADIDFPQALRLMGGSAANGDKSDPVVFQGDVERQMRALLQRYGFDRLPLTYGELAGLMEYCNELDSACGFGMFTDEVSLQAWQKNALDTWADELPQMLPALKLYMAGDIDKLRRLHQQEDTLTQLGRNWREFAG